MHSETQLRIPPDHPAFAGHFPGTPIVPGALLLDAVVHAALRMMPQGAPGQMQIGAAKFLSPVRPGEAVTMTLDLTAPGQLRFDLCASDGRKVATGTLVAPKTP